MTLRHDPYPVFRASRTPAGLYARQKWLAEASTAEWRSNFDATTAALYRGQDEDGLWNGSALKTIRHLFGLHLTVRAADAPIDAALDRLLALAAEPEVQAQESIIGPERLAGLPFAPSRRDCLLLPAALFLAAIFGRADDPEVLNLYQRLASDLTNPTAHAGEPASRHNGLRALVVHPDYAEHPTTGVLVDWLGRRQTPRGDWGEKIPFFQAFNALAHLKTPAAEAQCRKAFGLLREMQKADGSWGQTEPEWCTFLMVHALRNLGAL